MRISEFHDTLTIRKGPEDGSEYPLTTTPLFVGTDPSCQVQVQFDVTVRPFHARACAAKGGYRVRSAEGAPVYVNGRKTGMIRSRLLKPGDILKIGYTEFVLGCADAGLASSSTASWTEKDIAWAFRSLASKCISLARWTRGMLWRILRFALEHWIISLILIVSGLYLFAPGFGHWLSENLRALRDTLEL